MRILVINCGSSSIKYALVEMPAERRLAGGLLDRLGEGASQFRHEAGGETVERRLRVETVSAGVDLIAEALGQAGEGIAAVGHRVVHGADRFRQATIIDDAVLAAIEEYSSLAPLHNPANAAGIRACRRCFPDATHVAVFDTAFFQTLPPAAYLYAVPRAWHREHGIRRYGFHGSSHKYVTDRAAAILGIDKPNLVTMHLGNGCSMACVCEGRAVDTTMGFTPLEGLVMGTRSGDIDAGAILHLVKKGLSVDEIHAGLHHDGGLIGVSGLSHDVRDLLEAADPAAVEAIDLFVHRVRKYLGAYLVQLGRCDALVFTGGIGENAGVLRERICAGLDRFGITTDADANATTNAAAANGERAIHAPGAEVAVLVIPTNEELEIAKEVAAIAAR